MKTKLISFGILAALVIVAGYGVNQIKTSSKVTLSAESIPSTGNVVSQYAITAVRIGDKTFDVELALTPEQQALGLGGRESLAKNVGMLFVFKPAQPTTFWMKDMRFSLDTVWIADGKIIEISRHLPVPKPETKTENLPTYSPNVVVDYVLEINAGAADKMKVDDRVEIVDSFSI